MENTLPVVEKFHSLQGEGFHSGRSAFFIRLAGCEVGCPWCDTKQSWDKDIHPEISIESLLIDINHARDNGASFIVITGGEPLQHNLNSLCYEIKQRSQINKGKSIKIHIETSGVNEITGVYDWITLSPKRHKPPKEYFLKNFNELKIVISDEKDIEFAKRIRKKILELEGEKSNMSPKKLIEKNYYIQPAWKNKNGFNLAINFVKNNPNWTLSLQTHKYLNLK